LKYAIPSAKDDDGDKVKVEAKVEGSPLLPFMSFSNPSFTFEPENSHVGTYTITIYLTDSGDPPKKTQSSFQLTVTEKTEFDVTDEME